jgi:branched-chain amino acid transport system ATP-binding protein
LCGMHPEETAAVATLINSLRKRGITIVLVEHNVEAVMRLCNRIVVLNQGKKIAEGTPFEVANNQEVIEAYLGSGEEVC